MGAAGSREELQSAYAELVRLASDGGSQNELVRNARQDLFCRLADTSLALGEPMRALEWVSQGLELKGPPNVFVAELFVLRGRAKSALGKREEAAESYLDALDVHDQLLERSLGDP